MEETGADEVATTVHGHQDRIRSYELIAEAFRLAPTVASLFERLWFSSAAAGIRIRSRIGRIFQEAKVEKSKKLPSRTAIPVKEKDLSFAKGSAEEASTDAERLKMHVDNPAQTPM